jgi:hypothetical protein
MHYNSHEATKLATSCTRLFTMRTAHCPKAAQLLCDQQARSQDHTTTLLVSPYNLHYSYSSTPLISAINASEITLCARRMNLLRMPAPIQARTKLTASTRSSTLLDTIDKSFRCRCASLVHYGCHAHSPLAPCNIISWRLLTLQAIVPHVLDIRSLGQALLLWVPWSAYSTCCPLVRSVTR